MYRTDMNRLSTCILCHRISVAGFIFQNRKHIDILNIIVFVFVHQNELFPIRPLFPIETNMVFFLGATPPPHSNFVQPKYLSIIYMKKKQNTLSEQFQNKIE